MDILNRITEENNRLSAIFEDLDENQREVAEGLIDQASFMLIVLQDLQKAINESGVVGEYKNGANQFGTKQSAELQAYNQTLRSYNAVIGKLLKIVPSKPEKQETAQERWERIRKEKEEQLESEQRIRQLNEFCEHLNDEDSDALNSDKR